MKISFWRHLVQVLVIALLLTPLLGLNWAYGTFNSSILFGIQLTDPLSTLQLILAGKYLFWPLVAGTLLVLAFYFVVGGRVFCSWICPLNTLLELTDKLRRPLQKFISNEDYRLNSQIKYWILGIVLAVTLLSGIPAFDLVSPIGFLMRNLLFGLEIGFLIVVAIVFYELLVARRGWCRYLCPVGAFYSLVGRHSLIKVKVDREKCINCYNCSKECLVDLQLREHLAGQEEILATGECTNCGICQDKCQEGAIKLKPAPLGVQLFRQKSKHLGM